MVYYFSGTGNSAFAAKKLAEYTKDECIFIPDVFAAMQSDITVEAGDVIGVVCPIYAWGVPECVADFLSHVKVDKKAFAYIVVTCGSDAGKAVRQIERLFPYNSAYSVRMPENFTALFKTDSEELQKEKINVARQLLPRIAQGILARSNTYDVKEGFEAGVKTAVINPLFTLLFMKTSRFRVSSECTGCGACASLCPFKIIEMDKGKPKWKSTRCQMCMKCVMHCPTRALRIGSSFRHDVYTFPDAERHGHLSAPSSAITEPKASTDSTLSPAYGKAALNASLTLASETATGGKVSPSAMGLRQGGLNKEGKAALLEDIATLEHLISDLRRKVEAMQDLYL